MPRSGDLHTDANYDGDTTIKLSILTSSHIAANGTIYAYSDRRIKTCIEDVPDELALNQVRDIPCKYYEYIDKVEKNASKTIGFIAQEVDKILPIAVTSQTDFIPNIYRILENVVWNESSINDGQKNVFKMSCDLDDDITGIRCDFCE